jgi:tetratricopeptide (TPR) repeat protein
MGNRIQLRLVDSATGEVIWSDRVEIADPSMLEINLSKNVIAIASPYGVIARSELARNGDSYEPGYPCLLQFHQYLRYREKSDLKPVLECIDRSARRFSGDAYMLSMLAVAKEISTRVDSPYRIEGSSREMAQRAAQLDNRSSSAAFAVAQSAFIEGNCERGVAWGRRAVDLNPLNSRVVGYLGLYMLGCRLPEGEEYTARALEMDPNTDLVVAATLAFQKLQRGDAKGARELSLKYMATAEKVEPGLEVTYILSTAALGDHREARRAWQRLTKSYDLPETATPRQVMRGWIANPAVLRQVELAFEKVGLY